MKAFTRAGRAVDGFQQRWAVLAFPIAVWKRFNDDRAGNLAALIAFNGFISIFPLLLVLVTVLNIVLKNDSSLHRTSDLYGVCGVVLGLIAWLYLQAEVTLYAVEVDVVLARRRWPRSLLPESGESGEPADEGEAPAGDNKTEVDNASARDGKTGKAA
jgi:uncharacterized BrkB/YihY/UPF0761 family membrane protein